MTEWIVDVGRPDGKAGDEWRGEASSEAEATALALADSSPEFTVAYAARPA